MNNIKDFFEYILNAFKIWIIVQPWEMGLRVRLGKNVKLLKGGIYFRLPYIDSVYIQSVRLRAISLPMQTLTSKDKQTITLTGNLGYSITDVRKMYNKLYHPELTLSNLAMSVIADFIYNNDVLEIKASDVESTVTKAMQGFDYGIKVESFTLTNFAVVKTFRLIQDHSWVSEGMTLDEKK